MIVPPHAAAHLRPVVENDVHSRLNPTPVAGVLRPRSVEELQAVVRWARAGGRTLSIAGARHAMGGQQLAAGALVLDVRGLDRVVRLDRERGLVEVEAGACWPELIEDLHARQAGADAAWSIAQKQTGADRLTLGGAVSANVHGRGLRMPPIVADVESICLVDARGRLVRTSRERRPELFRRVVGGYGLFGVIATVTLRLVRRHRLVRLVELASSDELVRRFDERIAEGCTYGDFQFAVDAESPDFLRVGVLSCYRPVDGPPSSEAVEPRARRLSEDDWIELLRLAHVDKSRAFERYAAHYTATDGQLYWSDTHQLTTYLDGYHERLDPHLPAGPRGTEVITELSVPRERLTAFLAELRDTLRARDADVIYGTIRLIEADRETALPWARGRFACTVLNLHVAHESVARRRAAGVFRELIDVAIRHGGTYYLTYHRHATRAQVERCHPELASLLRDRLASDPAELLQSDWARHHAELLGLSAPASPRRRAEPLPA